jgi:von Willebrand factor type A domain
MRRIGKVLLGTTMIACLTAGLLVSQSAARGGATTSAGCVPAADIEAIVDDSGSMAITDQNRLRVQGMDLLIDTLPARVQLGAVEFGSGFEEVPAADTIFPPEPVGPNGTSMRALLAKVIHADNGATDYNSAFAKADADNPGSDARVFLTDGGHDVGTYEEAHLTHNVPTYVIGFSTGVSLTEDRQRLEKIAADTGGQFFQLNDAAQLQSVMNTVGAALSCQTPPQQFVDALKSGQTKSHSVAVGAATKSLQIALTWASPRDRFRLSHLRLIVRGRVVGAAPRPHVARLRVHRTASSTFLLVKVSGLRRGRLRFSVSAARIRSGAPRVRLTTQVGRGSRR